MRPPSSSPAGMLLMALIRRPAHAHKTSGFTDSCVPSFTASQVVDENKSLYLVFVEVVFSQHLGLLLEQLEQQHFNYF
jgi:hypothetical protein